MPLGKIGLQLIYFVLLLEVSLRLCCVFITNVLDAYVCICLFTDVYLHGNYPIIS